MKKVNNGKAQFAASREIISRMVAECQTGRYIYEHLLTSGAITISYQQFQRYLASLRPKDNEMKTKRYQTPPEKHPTPQENSASNPSRRSRRVLHDPTMTDERKKEIFG